MVTQQDGGNGSERPERLPKKFYETELFRLQAELVRMQEWVRTEGVRLVVVFEGRDAAGKGSTIKRVTEFLNPRVARIVALPTPSDRQKTQWYFQRYLEELPAAGEIRLFDRSWYNRAGVERVMGFCTPEEYRRFLHQTPIVERLLVEDGIMLRKYWFSVSDAEQERRFRSRLNDPMRQWKLSPMDLESITKWEEYSRAKDEMFVHTDIPEAPWYVIEADDKRRARINMISHLLSTIPYYAAVRPPLELPPRPPSRGYERPPRELNTYVPDYAEDRLTSYEESKAHGKKAKKQDRGHGGGHGKGHDGGSHGEGHDRGHHQAHGHPHDGGSHGAGPDGHRPGAGESSPAERPVPADATPVAGGPEAAPDPAQRG